MRFSSPYWSGHFQWTLQSQAVTKVLLIYNIFVLQLIVCQQGIMIQKGLFSDMNSLVFLQLFWSGQNLGHNRGHMLTEVF